jgi:hypothetical protein
MESRPLNGYLKAMSGPEFEPSGANQGGFDCAKDRSQAAAAAYSVEGVTCRQCGPN